MWVDHGREFYSKLMQEWLDNYILMYLTPNEGKSVTAERFIKTLKAKIYQKVIFSLLIANLIIVISAS